MEELIKDLQSGKRIVFFGGAGVSTASGIPDFRGKNGLYTKNANIEKILSYTYFKSNPESFYDNYRELFLKDKAFPNIIHKTLS